MNVTSFSIEESKFEVGMFFAKGSTLCQLIETAVGYYNMVNLSNGHMIHYSDFSDIEDVVAGYQRVTSKITIDPS